MMSLTISSFTQSGTLWNFAGLYVLWNGTSSSSSLPSSNASYAKLLKIRSIWCCSCLRSATSPNIFAITWVAVSLSQSDFMSKYVSWTSSWSSTSMGSLVWCGLVEDCTHLLKCESLRRVSICKIHKRTAGSDQLWVSLLLFSFAKISQHVEFSLFYMIKHLEYIASP